ncbi:MAG: T9SS type A sorting domain-containing protein [Janthinobacterium lividum]
MKTFSHPLRLTLFALTSTLLALPTLAQSPAFPPATVTRTQDLAQMAEQLSIVFPTLPSKLVDPNRPMNAYPSDATKPEDNWTDAAGHTITRSGFGLWNNYDDTPAGYFPGTESWRVGTYTPIDLLTMKNGQRTTSVTQWWTLRRPEIYKDVTEQLWGVMPADASLPKVTFAAVATTGGTGASAYIEKAITGTIDISGYPQVRDVPKIVATMRVPANATGPVPMIILIGTGTSATALNTYWNYVSAAGWGICAFNQSMLQPDNGQYLTSYLIGLVNKGNWRKPSDWGTLGAWAWGVSRLVDYMATDSRVDMTKLGVEGHSRYGKATLVAMAYEPRLAIAFPSCGGSLGTKMNRRHWGQDLENSSWDQEYHWVAGNFLKWMGPLNATSYLPRKIEQCPVDAHSLLSLCAPRPVFLNGGNQDTWTDPYGVYLTTVATSPVYQLLGAKGIVMADAKPVVDKGYITGDLAYRYHNGGHTDSFDWPSFIEFGTKYFGRIALATKAASLADYNIQVYPNPAQDNLSIMLGNNSLHVQRIELLDLAGRVVTQMPVSLSQKQTVSLSRNSLAAGVYMLRLHGDQVVNQKVILN